MTLYKRFITLLLIAIGSSSSNCLGRRSRFSSIPLQSSYIINTKDEKQIGYPDYTTTSLLHKAKQTYKYKSNLLSTQSIINCNVQTKKDGECSREDESDDTLFGYTNKEQSTQQLIKRSSRRQHQQDRSDILYTLRGGSSYNGDDDYNDNGYNGGYRDDDVGQDNGNYNNDGYYNDRPDSSQSYSKDGYYEDDSYGRGNGGSGYYDDEGRYHEVDYDDRGSSSRRRSKPKIPTALNQSNKKLGTMLLASGGIISALGITLFFNKMLMRLGNILFVIGVPITIGPGRTIGYFLQPKKARATGCLAFGIFLVLVGHPIIGIAMEIFGLFNLFGNMFPFAMMMLKNLPVVGGLFKGGSKGSGKRKSRYEDDRYYEEERYGRDEYRRDEREDDYRY